MFVTTCRRCGETVLAETSAHAIECAGESLVVCSTCYEQFRRWFFAPSAAAETAPALEAEAAQRR